LTYEDDRLSHALGEDLGTKAHERYVGQSEAARKQWAAVEKARAARLDQPCSAEVPGVPDHDCGLTRRECDAQRRQAGLVDQHGCKRCGGSGIDAGERCGCRGADRSI